MMEGLSQIIGLLLICPVVFVNGKGYGKITTDQPTYIYFKRFTIPYEDLYESTYTDHYVFRTPAPECNGYGCKKGYSTNKDSPYVYFKRFTIPYEDLYESTLEDHYIFHTPVPHSKTSKESEGDGYNCRGYGCRTGSSNSNNQRQTTGSGYGTNPFTQHSGQYYAPLEAKLHFKNNFDTRGAVTSLDNKSTRNSRKMPRRFRNGGRYRPRQTKYAPSIYSNYGTDDNVSYRPLTYAEQPYNVDRNFRPAPATPQSAGHKTYGISGNVKPEQPGTSSVGQQSFGIKGNVSPLQDGTPIGGHKSYGIEGNVNPLKASARRLGVNKEISGFKDGNIKHKDKHGNSGYGVGGGIGGTYAGGYGGGGAAKGYEYNYGSGYGEKGGYLGAGHGKGRGGFQQGRQYGVRNLELYGEASEEIENSDEGNVDLLEEDTNLQSYRTSGVYGGGSNTGSSGGHSGGYGTGVGVGIYPGYSSGNSGHGSHGYSQPARTAGYSQPAHTAGYSQPTHTAGYSRPVQGQVYNKAQSHLVRPNNQNAVSPQYKVSAPIDPYSRPQQNQQNVGYTTATSQNRKNTVEGFATNCHGNQRFISVNLKLAKGSSGNVFTRGYYGIPQCSVIASSSNVLFNIPMDGCGTREVPSDDVGGYRYSNTLVFMADGSNVLSPGDEAISIFCETTPTPTKLSAQTKPLLSLKISKGEDPSSPPSQGLSVGEKGTLSIIHQSNPNWDVAVSNCIAHDGLGENKVLLIDEHGCSAHNHEHVSPIRESTTINGDVIHYTNFQAFKFPDRENVYFQCTTEVCRNKCPKTNCEGIRQKRTTNVSWDKNEVEGEQEVFRGLTITLPGEIINVDVLNSWSTGEEMCLSKTEFAIAIVAFIGFILIAVVVCIITCVRVTRNKD